MRVEDVCEMVVGYHTETGTRPTKLIVNFDDLKSLIVDIDWDIYYAVDGYIKVYGLEVQGYPYCKTHVE